MSNTSFKIGSIITESNNTIFSGEELFDENNIPVLPLRDMVAFPQLSMPVSVGREASVELVKDASEANEIIFITTQKDPTVEKPGKKDLYSVGVVGKILKLIEMPDKSITAIIQTFNKAKLIRCKRPKPYLRGKIEPLEDLVRHDDDKETAVLFNTMDEIYQKILDKVGEDETRDLRFTLGNMTNPFHRTHFIAMNSPLDTGTKNSLLEFNDFKSRLSALVGSLKESLDLMDLKEEIQAKTAKTLSRQQKEHFLQQQIRTIQDELGGSVEDQELNILSDRADKKKWPKEIDEHFTKELQKLERYNASSPEYSVLYAYLETLLDLPWETYSKSEISLQKVQEILDKDHFGLKKVKERIVEQMAVMKLRGDLKSPILCLYGPPGVGKTSLGKSIADSLGREYGRIALGGLHDESEIRGHRKTYIGAMPGRIISALKKCGTSNPVLILDEIDKIGNDYKGDPSTALLEVLDPEQNKNFHDNYIDVDYDLSKVLFIATANDLSTVARPLLDRMELIEVNGYAAEEKVEIALRHLVGKVMEDNGLEKDSLVFEPEAVRYIIDRYTREAGVRGLEKKLAKVVRKIAVKKALDEDTPQTIDRKIVRELLGPEEVNPDEYENNDSIGVVTGLAWTQVGGEILFIESSLSPSKEGKLSLTGNLGDVMKESAALALQYIKSNADRLGIPRDTIDNNNIHVHVPEGAIPKDGPSAGISMLTSMASSFTGRKVRERIAMTGEITLRGKVLPVGGLKEKVLAAKRAGISDIILSEDNRRDIDIIEPEYISGLTFHYVKKMEEVLDLALI